MAGMTIEADSGAGATWAGARHGQNLLDTLKLIAAFSSIDFAVVGTGAATYEFRTYELQRGSDRTNVGLDPATGLNAAGNVPVVFSPLAGNVSSMAYSLRHKNETNAAYIWGQGQGSARNVRLRTDPAAIAVSPIGLRESSRNGASQATNTEIDALADAELEKQQAKETLTFTPKSSPNCLFGVNYFVGDRVTADYYGNVMNKRIISVTATVGDNGESLDFDFADI
jgi:hypothetical protein